MKIAYTMSGMPRFIENCASSQLSLINKLREKHVVDIYCQFNAFYFTNLQTTTYRRARHYQIQLLMMLQKQ